MIKTRLLVLCLLPTFLLAQNPDSLWFAQNYTKKEVRINMRDGVKLFTSIYIPKDKTTQHPILMTRTPYSCAPYGEKNFSSIWRSPRK